MALKIQDLLQRTGWLLIPSAAVLVLAFTVFSPNEPVLPAEPFVAAEQNPQPEPPAEPPVPETVMIELKGRVTHPGVYELPADARLQDAIRLAGGLLPDAESRAINLAMKVKDELSLYIPAVGEEAAMPLPAEAAGTMPGEGLVNINTADEAALMELPGIGPSKAAAIIAYREESGPFSDPEQLKEVPGIGDKTFEQLAASVTVH
ncbi:ComEA family DNA-binding protein [Indiicoccus explosivorum]|uniref:ComEA family DNA-binding protein n=1 Tax=Indiicoccus explosivorum TaxID=1917864 RepID=UPI000B452BC1|nr:ComEA family DNA-binding protein [Indiicoccus explosivorum]